MLGQCLVKLNIEPLPPSLSPPQSHLSLASANHVSPDQDRQFFTRLSQEGYHSNGYHGDQELLEAAPSPSLEVPEGPHPPSLAEHRPHLMPGSPLPISLPHPPQLTPQAAPVYPAGVFELPPPPAACIYDSKEKSCGGYSYYPKPQQCRPLGGHPGERGGELAVANLLSLFDEEAGGCHFTVHRMRDFCGTCV